MSSILLHYNGFLGVYYNKMMIAIPIPGKASNKADQWIFLITSSFAYMVCFLINLADRIQPLRKQIQSRLFNTQSETKQKRIQVSLRK
jgi:hypothetical protein